MSVNLWDIKLADSKNSGYDHRSSRRRSRSRSDSNERSYENITSSMPGVQDSHGNQSIMDRVL